MAADRSAPRPFASPAARRAADVLLAALIWRGNADVPLAVLGVRQIHPPGDWTAGIRIERDDRIAEEIVARPNRPVYLRSRVTDRPVDEIEGGVIRASQPHGAPAQLPAVPCPCVIAELTGTRDGIPPPCSPAGRQVVSVQKPARSKLSSGDADEDLVLHGWTSSPCGPPSSALTSAPTSALTSARNNIQSRRAGFSYLSTRDFKGSTRDFQGFLRDF